MTDEILSAVIPDQPAELSVALDRDGIAWQRDGDAWRRHGGMIAPSVMSWPRFLFERGPVRLIYRGAS